MTGMQTAGIAFGILFSFVGRSLAESTAGGRTPVVTTPHFAFYSDFDTNLNDALIATGVARKGGKPDLFHSGAEEMCFTTLPSSTRAAWEKAADYYTEVISPVSFGDREQFLIRAQLARFDEDVSKEADREFVHIARSFLGAAAPAYKACRWPAQEDKNRAWIEDVKSRLATDETKAAPRLEQLYQKRWGGLPIPVDVVETVDWSGANTILRYPTGGHILISTSYQGPTAVEAVFHEASHLLMDRGDPVRLALDGAAKAARFQLPGNLWHVVLFYTTGEAVRGILDNEEKAGYTPMVYGIYERGAWTEYRKPLEDAWRPYVAGEKTLSEAAANLIGSLRRSVDQQPDEGKSKSIAPQSP